MEFTNPDTARFALENNLESIQFEGTERSGKDGKITKQDVKNKIKQVEKIKNALQGYQGTIPKEDYIKKIIDLAVNVYQNETFLFKQATRPSGNHRQRPREPNDAIFCRVHGFRKINRRLGEESSRDEPEKHRL